MSVGDIMAKKSNYNKKGSVNKTKQLKKNKKINDETVKNQKRDELNEKNNFINVNKKQAVNKARQNLIYSSNDSSDEMSKLVKIVLIVTGIMILFYGITVFITRKVNAIKTAKLGKSSEKVTIQYDNVIIGSMLKIDGEYYVLIEKEDDEHHDEYETTLKSIEANDDSPKIYMADLSSSFNKIYLGKEKNYDSDLSNFKVIDTTLVKINDHKIEDTFDSYDSIKKELEELK